MSFFISKRNQLSCEFRLKKGLPSHGVSFPGVRFLKVFQSGAIFLCLILSLALSHVSLANDDTIRTETKLAEENETSDERVAVEDEASSEDTETIDFLEESLSTSEEEKNSLRQALIKEQNNIVNDSEEVTLDFGDMKVKVSKRQEELKKDQKFEREVAGKKNLNKK